MRVLRCNFGWKAVGYDAEFFSSMKTWPGELHERLIHVKIQSRKKKEPPKDAFLSEKTEVLLCFRSAMFVFGVKKKSNQKVKYSNFSFP